MCHIGLQYVKSSVGSLPVEGKRRRVLSMRRTMSIAEVTVAELAHPCIGNAASPLAEHADHTKATTGKATK